MLAYFLIESICRFHVVEQKDSSVLIDQLVWTWYHLLLDWLVRLINLIKNTITWIIESREQRSFHQFKSIRLRHHKHEKAYTYQLDTFGDADLSNAIWLFYLIWVSFESRGKEKNWRRWRWRNHKEWVEKKTKIFLEEIKNGIKK